MRISSNQIFLQGLSAMTGNQAELNRTQLEISSGRRVINASDDPVAAVRGVSLETAIAQGEQYIENGNYARNRLAAEENAVSSAINALQRVHELALQANNASQSNETRNMIAREIREQLDNLLRLGNTTTSDGSYLFAGYQEKVRPFSFSDGSMQYHGDDGRRELRLGPSRGVADADPGSRVFAGIRDGNGDFAVRVDATNTGTAVVDAGSVTDYGVWDSRSYTIRFVTPDSYEVLDDTATVIDSGAYDGSGDISFAGLTLGMTGEAAAGDSFTVEPSRPTDVFSIVNDLAQSLGQSRSNAGERAAQTNEINESLSAIGQALDHLVGIQTSIGTRLNVVDQEEQINLNARLQLEETLSNTRDVDVVEAATRFNQTLVSLQAAQQAFARVQQLSLFNYL